MNKYPTKNSENPAFEHQDSQTVDPRISPLLQDYILQENLAHFVREKTPERFIYTKGTGAFGKFTVTHDISQFTRAKLFSSIGNTCKLFVRFSSLAGEKGSADSQRDLRGFALKFYTEDGNWDLVGNNSPVFFIKDPKKFPDYIFSQKKHPKTNLRNPTLKWNFWSLNPESLHQILLLMSNRGIPFGYRHMNGYGSHTFSMINQNNERVWVKFHLKTQQVIKNFTRAEAEKMAGEDADFYQFDFIKAIENKKFPKWTLYIQTMTEKQASEFRWNPFDVTKVWSHDEFPLLEVGELELNEIPNHYFTQVESSTFSPNNVIDGIGFSPDKMLLNRLFSYADAHRYRLGINAHLLEVNQCPFMVKDPQETGFIKDSPIYENTLNYFPNRYTSVASWQKNKHLEYEINKAFVTNQNENENDQDHYSQPGIFYSKVMSSEEKSQLVFTIVEEMKKIEGPKKQEIVYRQLCHFFRANIELGMRVATGLQINIEENALNHFNF